MLISLGSTVAGSALGHARGETTARKALGAEHP